LLPFNSFLFWSNNVGYFVLAYACGFSFLRLDKSGLGPIPNDGILLRCQIRLKDEKAAVDKVYSV